MLAVAREHNFSRAAESCGVTQPTLSAAIKQLEDNLGVLLVNRSSRFHGLTADGERVLEWAKRIVSDTRAMRQEVRSPKTALVGHLTIAAVPTAAAMATQLTTPFREKHPDVRFTIFSQTSREILAMLDGLQIDAGLTYLDNEPLGQIRTLPLYWERYRLLTSAHLPLADRATVTWAEVAQIPLCLLTPDMQNRRIIHQPPTSSEREAAPTLESNSVIALFAHVRTGRWASILSENWSKCSACIEPIASIPIIDPQVVHQIGLVVPFREPMARLLQRSTMKPRVFSQTESFDAVQNNPPSWSSSIKRSNNTDGLLLLISATRSIKLFDVNDGIPNAA